MIDGLDDFKLLMKRLGDGDATAAGEVVDRYGSHVTNAIRRRFRTRKMRILYETEDCMQSVWGSIFSDIERVAKIQTPEHLMRYLARVAAHKLIDRERSFRSQGNNVYQECDLPALETSGGNVLAVDELTPSQVVANEDEWEVRTKGLSAEKRTILELHRQGHTSDEIAERTDFSGRGVRRVIQQFRDRFMRNTGRDARRAGSGFNKPSDDGNSEDCTE